MNKPPPVIYRKAYINLDKLFGDVFLRVTGEPMTANNIANFYLLRILFHTHFGYRHMRSNYEQFNEEEKKDVFVWLYSLMSQDSQLSYTSYRNVLRMAFGEDRDIYLNFVALMEKIGSGKEEVNLGIEDEFYTNKYPKDPKLAWDDPMHLIVEHATRDDLHFSSSYSFMYRWLKRVLARYAKMTTDEKFHITNMMRHWIRSKDTDLEYKGKCESTLDQEIDSSLRAREFAGRQLYDFQKNSRVAYAFHYLLDYSHQIQKHQPDVFETYILEALVHINSKDSIAALRCLKTYFELTMFELNNNMKHCMRTFRLGVPSQTPLMYAPILQARVHRLFGDLNAARSLLHESLQQAQLRNDEICHQMGNIELHTVDIIGNGPFLENRHGKITEHSDKDPRILRKALKHIDDLHGHTRAGPCCPQSEDDFELVAEMDSYGKMLMLMKGVAEGTYHLKYNRIAEIGIACPLGTDEGERGEKVATYGTAFMTSNMIRNGMYQQARIVSKEFLANNPEGERYCYLQLEAHAVITVNLAYSYAAQGNYNMAEKTIANMKLHYADHMCWISYRHIEIANAIIRFERHFVKARYESCQKHTSLLAPYSEIEFKLRQSLLMCVEARETEAIDMLKHMEVFDVRGRIRIHMQVASIYMYMGSFEKVLPELNEAMQLTDGTTLKDIRTMIRRREATLRMCQNRHDEALKICKEILYAVDTTTTILEKICFYVTAARSARLGGKEDPRRWLKSARSLLGNNVWPAMLRMVISEIAQLHLPDGMFPDEDRVSKLCEQYEESEADYVGRCEWLLH
uniref:Anaphase-promoting complex subunit 5 n=1 Tax=Caenorhabditis tropicalis TaxID=1561998 RepID=A0A1I7TL88_9PELO